MLSGILDRYSSLELRRYAPRRRAKLTAWKNDLLLLGVVARPRLRGLDLCGQAIKGTWGMSWYQEAMKGVEDCEKSGEAVKQAMIPEFPN